MRSPKPLTIEATPTMEAQHSTLESSRKGPVPFQYELPPARIAQRPVYPYDSAKLMVLKAGVGPVEDRTFRQLSEVLLPSDVLVFNDTRVLPARLFCRLADTGGEIEVLLLRPAAGGDAAAVWSCLARPMKKLTPGRCLRCGSLADGGELYAEVLERNEANQILLKFETKDSDKSVREAIEQVGVMPIPPYIRNGRGDESDVKDYQPPLAHTEAAKAASVAAPTASLHFTEELLSELKEKGVTLHKATLHVGAASFLPVWNGKEQTYTPPGTERFFNDPDLVAQLRAYRADGRRVIAVGTTIARALESMAAMLVEGKESHGEAKECETSLFITPGYQFKLLDGLVTNFHQPGTTHLLLVEALLGRAALSAAYQRALERDYRFLSYGDGMVILP